MISTAITFLDHDVEISSATRHDDCVAVTVKDQDGHRVELYLHEDVWSLIYEAALDAPQYQPPAPAEPEPERVLATDLQVGDVIRWQVPATHSQNEDGRVSRVRAIDEIATVAHIEDDGLDYVDLRLVDGHGDELRPFIKRTALIEVLDRKAVAR